MSAIVPLSSAGFAGGSKSTTAQEVTQPGADRLFTTRVLARLAGLALVRIGAGDVVQPLPAVGRYAMAAPALLSLHA